MRQKQKLLFVIVSIIGILSVCSVGECRTTKTRELKEIQEKSQNIKRKIEETKRKERIAVNKLTQIQRELSVAQQQLRRNKFKLESTQENIRNTEETLAELKHDFVRLKVHSRDRIKQIYQGQRLKMFEVLLKSRGYTDFLDNLYYQKLLIAADKTLLQRLSEQSEAIEKYKDQLAKQKIKFAAIVNDIDKQKRQISGEHSTQSTIVSKLRNERASYEKAERELEHDSNNLVSEINRLIGKNPLSPSARGTGNFMYPIHGRLTSPFGPRIHPIHRVSSFHSGVDLAAPYGTAIKASDSGKVIFNGWYGGYGRVVIVDHGRDYSTLYAHLSKAVASSGRSIGKGEVIGYEGQTGYSTGPHLHFEVRKNGKPQNPMNYLR